jgi:hypothetical protein
MRLRGWQAVMRLSLAQTPPWLSSTTIQRKIVSNVDEPEGQTMPENEEVAPATATEAQQDVAQANDAKADATSTAKASDELSEDDLEAVGGGARRIPAIMFADL